MSISVNLDFMFVKRAMKLSDLAETIDFAIPEHSILKSNIAGMIHIKALEAIYQDWTDCLGIYD